MEQSILYPSRDTYIFEQWSTKLDTYSEPFNSRGIVSGLPHSLSFSLKELLVSFFRVPTFSSSLVLLVQTLSMTFVGLSLHQKVCGRHPPPLGFSFISFDFHLYTTPSPLVSVQMVLRWGRNPERDSILLSHPDL